MEFYLSPFVIILSLFLFVFMLSTLATRSKYSLPPGPRKIPFIGNLHLLMSNPSRLPHYILRDLALKYGPVMHLQLGEIPTVIISSPEAAKEVLKTHDLAFANRPSLFATEILFYRRTDIAFAPYGAYWRQMRKIVSLELLSAKRIHAFKQIREKEFLNLCRWIASNGGSPINLTERMISTSYNIISWSTIRTVDQETFVPLLKEVTEILGGFHLADFYPSIKLFRHITGLKTRIERLHKEYDQMLEQVIEQRRLTANRTNVETKVVVQENCNEDDLLDVLLKLQEGDHLEFLLTMDNIKAVILVLLIGGSETAPTTVDWAMSEIMKNPQVLNKAQYEVRQVFDSKGGRVDESYLDELNYLKLVIKETLRMHPPGVMLIPRESMKSCEILGYEIPAKTRVFINAWAISRDQKNWEDPEKFIPERFEDSSVDYKGNDFRYIPFGAGRRICPGLSHALASVETQLALLLYHFDWNLPGGMKPEEIDMIEDFGLSVRRKNELCLIPTIARPLPAE